MDHLLSPMQTALMLNKRVGTLATWRAKRRYALPYVKVGGRIAYRESDVQKFLDARTVEGTETGANVPKAADLEKERQERKAKRAPNPQPCKTPSRRRKKAGAR